MIRGKSNLWARCWRFESNRGGIPWDFIREKLGGPQIWARSVWDGDLGAGDFLLNRAIRGKLAEDYRRRDYWMVHNPNAILVMQVTWESSDCWCSEKQKKTTSAAGVAASGHGRKRQVIQRHCCLSRRKKKRTTPKPLLFIKYTLGIILVHLTFNCYRHSLCRHHPLLKARICRSIGNLLVHGHRL